MHKRNNEVAVALRSVQRSSPTSSLPLSARPGTSPAAGRSLSVSRGTQRPLTGWVGAGGGELPPSWGIGHGYGVAAASARLSRPNTADGDWAGPGQQQLQQQYQRLQRPKTTMASLTSSFRENGISF